MTFLYSKKYSFLQTLSKYAFVFIIGFSLLLPFAVVHGVCDGSQTGTTTQGGTPPAGGTPPQGGTPPAGGTPPQGGTPCEDANPTLKVTIHNPLDSSLSDIPSFIEALLRIVLTVGVPIVTLAIIYCGFLFIKAQGAPEEISKAKKAFMYTLIGAALLMGSWILANAIQGTVKDIISTS